MTAKMKKLSFYLLIFTSLFGASCKKCGHCVYKATTYSSEYNGDTYCKTRSVSTKLVYDAEKNACEGSGDKWVTE